MAAVCENNQPIMVKIPHYFFYNLKKSTSLSERAVSDSPSVHVTEGKKSRPFVMLPYKHRHSTEGEDAVRYYWLLAVAAGDTQYQRQWDFSSVVFWDALTNIGVSIPLHLSRWGHCGFLKFHSPKKCPRNVPNVPKIGEVPNTCRNQCQRLLQINARTSAPDKVSTTRLFSKLPLKELFGTL